jgi:hypothetical protein
MRILWDIIHVKMHLFILVEAIFTASGPVMLVLYHRLFHHPSDFLQVAQVEEHLVEEGELWVEGEEGVVEEGHTGDFKATDTFRIMHLLWTTTVWAWKSMK